MPIISDPDFHEFQKRTELMLEFFNQHNIPHILVEVKNDDVDPKDSPVNELASLFQMLINSLIADVVIGHNEQATILLEHAKHTLETQIFLMGSMLEERIAERKEGLGHKEEEEEEELTEIPTAFMEAFKEEGKHNGTQ
jgi:hypothetical protein